MLNVVMLNVIMLSVMAASFIFYNFYPMQVSAGFEALNLGLLVKCSTIWATATDHAIKLNVL
jgi:hypothetical protein